MAVLRNIARSVGLAKRPGRNGGRRAAPRRSPRRVPSKAGAAVTAVRPDGADAEHRERARSEKLAAVGLLAAGAMHEINNPLSAIIAYAQFLLKGDLTDAQRADVERIAGEALRASRIVHNLLTFAHPMRPQKILLDVNDAVGRALDLRSRQLAADHIAVHTDFRAELPPVEADAYQIEQVFVNVINNARDAMLAVGGDRLLTVATAACDTRVLVSFDDTGPGIPEEIVSRVFDPFFTTKDQARGTGLGLAVCYGIMREHGGCITAHNLARRGARFVVELPAAAEASHGR